MGISNLFDIASSGVTAQRLAIEVAGENIANINTQGYSRQQVTMVNRPVTTSNGFALGTGVQIQTVQRSYDAMLQQQIVDGNSSFQQGLAQQSALEQVQPAFNELTSDGLGKALDNFFGAWQDLSTNPQGTAERQSLLSRSQILVDTFHQVSTSLSNVVSGANKNLTGITDEVTDNARNLALVNLQIIATGAVGGNPNELMDQRDLLVQKISEKVGITPKPQPDGTVTVELKGGDILVSGSSHAKLYYASAADAILLTAPVAAGAPPPATVPGDTDVTATIGTLGELGGTIMARDQTQGYLDTLDKMAFDLVKAVNDQHKTGYGIDGPPASTGQDFFDSALTTSANIALDSTLVLDKRLIAAAVGTNTGDNLNALKFASIKGGFDASYNSLVSSVGSDTQAAQNTTAQRGAFLKQLNTLRDSNSGVSLDEELTNLTKYQQAFQGSAKVINTATEMLDIVMGLVR